MKLLALIPARGGSKGVPGKNIRLLGGESLLWYSYEAARISGLFSEIVLSTEDESIAEVGKKIGMMVPFIRPADLANDSAKSIDVVNHALTCMEEMGYQYNAVVLLQPTSPFRRKNLIADAALLMQERGADSIVSVRKVPHQYNPHWVFEATDDYTLHIATGEQELISQRQNLPDAYYRDGQIYITKTAVLKERNAFIGNKLTYILNEYAGSAINIDTLEDWQAAEQYILHHPLEF